MKKETVNEEYEMMRQRAMSDRIRRSLAGKLSPQPGEVVEKLNRRRKEHEEGLERNHGK